MADSILARLRRTAATIHRVPAIRQVYARVRYQVLKRTRGLKTLGEHGSIKVTSAHNQRSLTSYPARNEKLLMACMCIEDIADAPTLVIGCRTEEELFLFEGYGFSNVRAVDLMSYSPLVDIGDMHALPYGDSSFEFVYCAYTLSYSADPALAAREILRVVRPGGVIALAIEYGPWERRAEVQDALLGYHIIPPVKLELADDLLTLFRSSVDRIFVRYDAELRRHHDVDGAVSNPSPVMVVFSVR